MGEHLRPVQVPFWIQFGANKKRIDANLLKTPFAPEKGGKLEVCTKVFPSGKNGSIRRANFESQCGGGQNERIDSNLADCRFTAEVTREAFGQNASHNRW